MASTGGTAAQLYGGTYTDEETMHLLGDSTSSSTSPVDLRPTGNVTSKVTMATIIDGTSQHGDVGRDQAVQWPTSSTRRCTMAHPAYSMDMVYPALPGDVQQPGLAVGCATTGTTLRSYDLIDYRGGEYYRNLPMTANYSHTIPPNFSSYDCGNTATFNQSHAAARSYHPGGANAAFCDGSVHFFKSTINPADLVGPRHQGRRRGHQLGRLLSQDPASGSARADRQRAPCRAAPSHMERDRMQFSRASRLVWFAFIAASALPGCGAPRR